MNTDKFTSWVASYADAIGAQCQELSCKKKHKQHCLVDKKNKKQHLRKYHIQAQRKTTQYQVISFGLYVNKSYP